MPRLLFNQLISLIAFAMTFVLGLGKAMGLATIFAALTTRPCSSTGLSSSAQASLTLDIASAAPERNTARAPHVVSSRLGTSAVLAIAAGAVAAAAVVATAEMAETDTLDDLLNSTPRLNQLRPQ